MRFQIDISDDAVEGFCEDMTADRKEFPRFGRCYCSLSRSIFLYSWVNGYLRKPFQSSWKSISLRTGQKS